MAVLLPFVADIVLGVLSFGAKVCSGGGRIVCCGSSVLDQVDQVDPADDTKDELDGNLNFHFNDRSYILEKYINKFNINQCGKFKIDIEALFIYLNVRLKNIIGRKRKDLFFRSFYGANVYDDDYHILYMKWTNAINTLQPIVVKHRHSFSNSTRINYCVTEAYPVITTNNMCKGYKGITCSVDKKKFDELDEEVILQDIFDSSYDLSTVPIDLYMH
jgi:hypothetical protein